MTAAEGFILADNALEDVLRQIKPEQWDTKVPDDMSTRQPGITLRKLVNYHAYDEAWVPETLAGKSIDEIGKKYDGDLLGEDPVASYHTLAEAAAEAARAADPKQSAHLTYGDFPNGEYLQHITIFRGFRSYDIAKFIGAPSSMKPDLVQALWDIIEPEAENWRAMGVFAAAVPVPEDADLQSRLLGLSGRDPQA